MNSDYGFMKTGTNLNQTNTLFDETQLRQMLSLFLSNAVINASKYCKLANRNGVTKEDINLGLKYEVREFFERTTLIEDFEEIKKDYDNLENEEPIKFKAEWVDIRTGIIDESKLFDTEDEVEAFIDNLETNENLVDFTIIELTKSDIIMNDLTDNQEELQPFKEVSINDIQRANLEDRTFLLKINKYKNEWDTWEPQTPIHTILKNAVTTLLINNNE